MTMLSWTVNWAGVALTYLSIPVSVVLFHKLFKRSVRYRASHLIFKFTILAALAGLFAYAIAFAFAMVGDKWFHWGEQNLVGWFFLILMLMPWERLLRAVMRWTGWRVSLEFMYFYLSWLLVPLLFASIGGMLGAVASAIRWLARRALPQISQIDTDKKMT